MDNSREHDLWILSRRMNDAMRPLWARKSAYRAYTKILDEMSDRKLVELRHRLIRANRASDINEAEKIELQIRDYVKQKA